MNFGQTKETRPLTPGWTQVLRKLPGQALGLVENSGSTDLLQAKADGLAQIARQRVHAKIKLTMLEPPWSRLVAGAVLESEAFLKRICRELKGNRRERTAVRRLKGRAGWRQIVGAVEEAKGEGWEQFCLRHGD